MGDFSRLPLNVLLANQGKGYVGLHIEQGVPVLDRDLNLLSDLVSATLREIISRYIGNGVSVGKEGFEIDEIPEDNDFVIGTTGKGGAALVGGIEMGIDTPTNYSDQAGIPALTTPDATQPDPRIDLVYLDTSLREVGGDEDADLLNTTDVGIQTSVRQAPAWVVRVAEGVPIPAPADGHAHYPLAQLTRPRGKAEINSAIITDLREPMAPLTDVERRLRALEALLLQPAFDPSPNQFNPKFGQPGDSVTLFGRNFNIGTVTVRFGAATAVIVGSPTSEQIVVEVPTAPPGAVTITVETSGGAATSDDTYTILPPPPPEFDPPPNQFNPKFGPVGSNVTLFGTNFNIGTVVVRFGAVTAVIVGLPSATQVVAKVPAMPTGPTTITVQTGGGSVTSSDTFTVT